MYLAIFANRQKEKSPQQLLWGEVYAAGSSNKSLNTLVKKISVADMLMITRSAAQKKIAKALEKLYEYV